MGCTALMHRGDRTNKTTRKRPLPRHNPYDSTFCWWDSFVLPISTKLPDATQDKPHHPLCWINIFDSLSYQKSNCYRFYILRYIFRNHRNSWIWRFQLNCDSFIPIHYLPRRNLLLPLSNPCSYTYRNLRRCREPMGQRFPALQHRDEVRYPGRLRCQHIHCGHSHPLVHRKTCEELVENLDS